MQIDPSLKKTIKYDVKHNKVLDDDARFSKPVIKKEFSTATLNAVDYVTRSSGQFHCTKLQILMGQIGGCVEYENFNYAITGEESIIRRNYRKWTEIIGEFGGFMKVISSAVFFLYSFYRLRQVARYLRGLIFDDNDKKNRFLKKKNGRGDGGVTYQQVVKELTKSRS